MSIVQVVSHLDAHNKDDTIVGFRPLMYFCFDHMSNQPKTVALTCPRLVKHDMKKSYKLLILPQRAVEEQSA